MVELLSHSQRYMSLVTAISQFCMTPAGRDVCRSFVYVLFGPSNLYFDKLLHTILNHIPAGASYKQFIHYGQIAAGRKSNHSNWLKKNPLFNPFIIDANDVILKCFFNRFIINLFSQINFSNFIMDPPKWTWNIMVHPNRRLIICRMFEQMSILCMGQTTGLLLQM